MLQALAAISDTSNCCFNLSKLHMITSSAVCCLLCQKQALLGQGAHCPRKQKQLSYSSHCCHSLALCQYLAVLPPLVFQQALSQADH
jgi:hypothetical protein